MEENLHNRTHITKETGPTSPSNSGTESQPTGARSAVRCWYKTLPLVFPLVVGILGGCKSGQPVDAWYVLEMRDSRWTLVHTDHTRHQQTRYVVTCDWYQSGDHEAVPGDCDLPVGRVLVWNGFLTRHQTSWISTLVEETTCLSS
jgi:hypothetical protein